MKLIRQDLLTQMSAQARESPRRRSHHNIHEHLSDPVQKLLVAATTESYFRPHRHADKSEFALVLRGRFAVFRFDNDGSIAETRLIGEGTGINGLELPANTWHCWLALTDDAVFFETKQGPYDPASAAEAAPWAPAENSPETPEFMARLKQTLNQPHDE